MARLRGIPDDGVHPGGLYLPHVENGRSQRCRFDEPQGADSPLPDIYLCPFIHGLLPLQDDDAPLVDSATDWGKYRAICRAARQFCLEDQCARHRNWRIDWRYHGRGADANEQSLRGLDHRVPHSRMRRDVAVNFKKTYTNAGLYRLRFGIYLYFCILVVKLYLFIHLKRHIDYEFSY